MSSLPSASPDCGRTLKPLHPTDAAEAEIHPGLARAVALIVELRLVVDGDRDGHDIADAAARCGP